MPLGWIESAFATASESLVRYYRRGVGNDISHVGRGEQREFCVYLHEVHRATSHGIKVDIRFAVYIGSAGGAVAVYEHHVAGLQAKVESHVGYVGYVDSAVYEERIVVAALYREVVELYNAVFYVDRHVAELVVRSGECEIHGRGVEVERAVEHRTLGAARNFQIAVEGA